MKKLLAFVFALLTVFLCSCSNKNNNNATTSTALTYESSTAVSTTETIEYFTDWGTDLLPENFPAPPEKAYNLSVSTGQASETGYRSDWVRLTFICPEPNFYMFANDLQSKGYKGGFKNISSPSTYFPAGYNGGWQDGKHLVLVYNASKKSDSNDIIFVLDILECIDNFPEALTEVFPKFEGYSGTIGSYFRYDTEGKLLADKYEGTINLDRWYWDFGFENAFIGVTLEEAEAYAQKLVDAEFSGASATDVVDGCSVVSYDLIKEIGDKTYGAFMVYNQITKTLDIVYTNEIEFVIGYD